MNGKNRIFAKISGVRRDSDEGEESRAFSPPAMVTGCAVLCAGALSRKRFSACPTVRQALPCWTGQSKSDLTLPEHAVQTSTADRMRDLLIDRRANHDLTDRGRKCRIGLIMGMEAAPIFDTHSAVKRFAKAGFKPEQAEALAEQMFELSVRQPVTRDELERALEKIRREMATKTDLAQLEIRLEEKMGQIEIRLEDKMGQLETRLEDKMGQLETRLEDKMGQLEEKMEAKFEQVWQLENRMLRQMVVLAAILLAGIPIIMSALQYFLIN